MYCTNCGKPTNGESSLCGACISILRAHKAESVSAPLTELTELPYEESIASYNEMLAGAEKVGNPKLGLGGALASTIISNVGVYLAYIFFLIAMYIPIVGNVLNVVVAVPMLVVSLILGIKAIVCFKNAVGRKPIATLILGIVGVATAASIALLVFLTVALTGIGFDYFDYFEYFI